MPRRSPSIWKAAAAAEFLRSNLLLLTNEQATTAAVRNAFQTFLRNRAGKKDTVFIMVAGHGTVDSKGSYILTYDSDPQDLSTTAIPMQEIQDLVQQELSKVGRVVLLADVCRAAAIGATKPTNVNAAVERLGEATGRDSRADGQPSEGSLL